jgi:hypothetical protein
MSPLDRFRYIRTLLIPRHAKDVLWCLASHANNAGTCWVSRSLLATEARISEGTTYYAIEWLCSHGLLIRQYRAGQSSAFKLTLEAFAELQATPSATDAPPRQPLTTEVATLKGNRAKPKRQPREPKCSCGSALGDGSSCILCHRFRESDNGVKRVAPTLIR